MGWRTALMIYLEGRGWRLLLEPGNMTEDCVSVMGDNGGYGRETSRRIISSL